VATAGPSSSFQLGGCRIEAECHQAVLDTASMGHGFEVVRAPLWDKEYFGRRHLALPVIFDAARSWCRWAGQRSMIAGPPARPHDPRGHGKIRSVPTSLLTGEAWQGDLGLCWISSC